MRLFFFCTTRRPAQWAVFTAAVWRASTYRNIIPVEKSVQTHCASGAQWSRSSQIFILIYRQNAADVAEVVGTNSIKETYQPCWGPVRWAGGGWRSLEINRGRSYVISMLVLRFNRRRMDFVAAGRTLWRALRQYLHARLTFYADTRIMISVRELLPAARANSYAPDRPNNDCCLLSRNTRK